MEDDHLHVTSGSTELVTKQDLRGAITVYTF